MGCFDGEVPNVNSSNQQLKTAADQALGNLNESYHDLGDSLRKVATEFYAQTPKTPSKGVPSTSVSNATLQKIQATADKVAETYSEQTSSSGGR